MVSVDATLPRLLSNTRRNAVRQLRPMERACARCARVLIYCTHTIHHTSPTLPWPECNQESFSHPTQQIFSICISSLLLLLLLLLLPSLFFIIIILISAPHKKILFVELDYSKRLTSPRNVRLHPLIPPTLFFNLPSLPLWVFVCLCWLLMSPSATGGENPPPPGLFNTAAG